jgi:hypothetical protein
MLLPDTDVLPEDRTEDRKDLCGTNELGRRNGYAIGKPIDGIERACSLNKEGN